MEVDTDDDLIETSNKHDRSQGPPPDVTYHNKNSKLIKDKKVKLHSKAEIVKSTSPNNNHTNRIHHNSNTSENQPLLSDEDNTDNGSDYVHLICNSFEHDPEFSELIKQVEFAIDHNILPQRIYEGSSGSYFAKNSELVK
jgi:hypothetical protein